MTGRNKSPPTQTSLFDAFAKADFASKTAHMPSSLEEAPSYYQSLIERYHAAIIAGDPQKAQAVFEEAETLAVRLNGGTHFGIKGGEDAVCPALERATAAPSGEVPLWGQTGEFTLDVGGCAVRVEFEGLYGLCFPQFSANAVHWDRPFISETGYRSFLQHGFDCSSSGITVDRYVRAAIEQHIELELKGKLRPIAEQYRIRARKGPSPEPEA